MLRAELEALSGRMFEEQGKLTHVLSGLTLHHGNAKPEDLNRQMFDAITHPSIIIKTHMIIPPFQIIIFPGD